MPGSGSPDFAISVSRVAWPSVESNFSVIRIFSTMLSSPVTPMMTSATWNTAHRNRREM